MSEGFSGSQCMRIQHSANRGQMDASPNCDASSTQAICDGQFG